MPQPLLVVSFGEADPAIIVSTKRWAWPQFAAYLTAPPPVVAAKDLAGWYNPAEYEKPRRRGKYFIARYALTLDIDVADMFSLESVRELCAPYAHAIYPTFSHAVEKPRFRAVVPLSRPVGYDEFQAISRRFCADLDIELFARESHVATQMMFNPARSATSPPHWTHGNMDAPFLDADAVLARYTDWTDRTSWPRRAQHDGVHQKDTAVDPRTKPGIVGQWCRAFDVPTVIERFKLPYTPTATPNRYTFNRGSRAEGMAVYDDGQKAHSHHDSDPAHGQSNSWDLTRQHLYGHMDTDPSLPITQQPSFAAMVKLANEQPQITAAAATDLFDDISATEIETDASAPAPQPEGIPKIDLKGSAVVDDNLERVLAVLEGIAPAANLVVYGNALMRVVQGDEGVNFEICDHTQLPSMLVGHCTFTRSVEIKTGEDKGKKRRAKVDMPPTLAKAVVTKAALMRRAVVDRIARTPLLQDGNLVAARGFSGEHRAWLLTPDGVALGDCTQDGARAALARIEQWLDEFPFDGALDRSVALAAILTAALRASLDHAPGFVISKPDYGSGASTLCDIINVVLCGRSAAVINAGNLLAETEKTLDSALLAGAPSIVLDNVPDGQQFNSVALAQVITQRTRQIRTLGRSVTFDCPCTQLVLVNGNNIRIADDLIRRFVLIRLNPRCESPHKRAFKHPAIVAEAHKARAAILSDCYTIIEAYRLHGNVDLPPFAGFEQWARSVAAALVWLGYENPIDSQAKIERDDAKKDQWRAIMQAWYDSFGSAPVTVREALEQDFADEKSSSRAELHRLVSELCSVGGRTPQTLNVSFGAKLRGMAEKVLSGYIFDSPGKKRADQTLWRLRRADELWLDA